MITLNQLLRPKGNLEEIASVICRHLAVPVVQTALARQLQNHPDYPSLAALHDVLQLYKIEAIALKDCNLQALDQTAKGFLVQVKFSGESELFAYIYQLTDHDVYWYNPKKHRTETISREEFSKLFTGYAMLFDASDISYEHRNKIHRSKEIITQIIEHSLLLAIPVMSILCIGVYTLFYDSEHKWFTICYTLLLLIGFMTGMLLLLYEYNQYSPVVSSFCSISRKTNCAAVLQSKASKVVGIPWTVIGTSYFMGILLAMLVSWFSESVIYCAVWLHLFTIPYIFYSFYYQFRKVRQWCPLCICVQVILLLLLACAIGGNIYGHSPFSYIGFLILSVCLVISFAVLYLLWNLSQQYKLRLHIERSLIRLKYNKEVFSALLHKEEQIEMPTNDCGIVLGNPHGSIHIVKVCNPYCSHCAAAQQVLQELVSRNPDVKLQMIFAVDPNSEYYKNTPVDLFLSLYYEQADMEAVLSEWYASKDKNLDVFKSKHPTSGQTDAKFIMETAAKMFHFCQQMKIKETPTIFINGYQLPEIYHVIDLLYFI